MPDGKSLSTERSILLLLGFSGNACLFANHEKGHHMCEFPEITQDLAHSSESNL